MQAYIHYSVYSNWSLDTLYIHTFIHLEYTEQNKLKFKLLEQSRSELNPDKYPKYLLHKTLLFSSSWAKDKVKPTWWQNDCNMELHPLTIFVSYV